MAPAMSPWPAFFAALCNWAESAPCRPAAGVPVAGELLYERGVPSTGRRVPNLALDEAFVSIGIGRERIQAIGDAIAVSVGVTGIGHGSKQAEMFISIAEPVAVGVRVVRVQTGQRNVWIGITCKSDLNAVVEPVAVRCRREFAWRDRPRVSS